MRILSGKKCLPLINRKAEWNSSAQTNAKRVRLKVIDDISKVTYAKSLK